MRAWLRGAVLLGASFLWAGHPASAGAVPATGAGPAVPAAPRPLVVGYLPQWGLYNDPPWLARDLVVSGAATLLDQVNYAQGTVREGRCVVADPEADLNRVYSAEMSVDGKADVPTAPLRGGLHQLALLRERYPRIRTLISLEGKAQEFALAAQPETRVAFVSSCVEMFLRGRLTSGAGAAGVGAAGVGTAGAGTAGVGTAVVEAPGLFDGIDLDWEFPKTAADGANYVALVAEFRRQMDGLEAERAGSTGQKGRSPSQVAGIVPGSLPRHLLLAVAVGPGTGRYPGVDWAKVAGLVDEAGLMNYDYNGPWQQQTGMLAPLYTIVGDPRPQNTVDATVREYEAAGIPAGKLLVGVPFYGYHWQGVAVGSQHGLFQAGQAVRADTPYREIAAMLPQATLYRDEHSQTPWLFDGQTFWTFDDPVSARAKAAYATEHGLGGVMVWELSGDTADAQLLRAIRGGLAPAGETAAGRPAGK